MTPLDITTKAGAKLLQSEISAALAPLLEQHGIKLTKNSATYSEDGLSLRLAFEPNTLESAKVKWERHAPRYGLPVAALGTEITLGNARFRVTGIDPKTPAKPVKLIRIKDAALFKCSVPAALAALPKPSTSN